MHGHKGDGTRTRVFVCLVTDPVAFSAVFSEAVFGFTGTDISVAGGSVINFLSLHPTLYTFSVDASTPFASLVVGYQPANLALTNKITVYLLQCPRIMSATQISRPR